MATKSIFDCESLDAQSQPERQQIIYDDDDLFGFGCDQTDEINAVPRNVSISVTFAHDEDNGRKNGKRKAKNISKFENGRVFKVAKKNVPSIKVVTNGKTRRAVENNGRAEEDYELLHEIGCGTYGRVYKAKWKITDEVIAIKRLVCKMTGPYAVMFFFFHYVHRKQ